MNGFKKINLNMKNTLTICNKPNIVYIPLVNNNEDNVLILVKKGDYVFKGSILAKVKDDFKVNIFSSVSGKVIDFEEHTIFNGEKVKCVVIENDFKERMQRQFDIIDDLNSISKKDFIESLKNSGIIEDSMPIYTKYDTNNKINTLIIKGFENYKGSEYFIIKERIEQLLEMIDSILEINNIPCAIIVIKKENKELLKYINKHIGTYLKIKVVVVSNSFILKNKNKLVKKLTNTNCEDYLKEGIVISTPSCIYAMYEALKLHKPITEKVVTFLGDGLKKPQNVLVKIGTKLSEIISEIGGVYKTKNLIMITNIISENIEDLVITQELNTVLVVEKDYGKDFCRRFRKSIDARNYVKKQKGK